MSIAIIIGVACMGEGLTHGISKGYKKAKIMHEKANNHMHMFLNKRLRHKNANKRQFN